MHESTSTPPTDAPYSMGETVFVVADNYGSIAVIVAYREDAGQPPSHWQVKTDHDTFWAFDFEIKKL